MKLTYTKPAEHWSEAMPIGNGTLGALIFGMQYSERIALNHDSLWAGKKPCNYNPLAAKNLARIQKLIFSNKFREAEELGKKVLLGIPPRIKPYEPLADLLIEIQWKGAYSDYRRYLDLTNGEAITEFKIGKVLHRRIAFASYPDNVIVVRHECSCKGALSGRVILFRLRNSKVKIENAEISLEGNTDDKLKFASAVKILSDDEAVLTPEKDSVFFHGTSSITIIVSAVVGGKNPLVEAQKISHKAAAKGYTTLHNRHLKDRNKFSMSTQISIESQKSNEIYPENEFIRLQENNGSSLFISAACINYRKHLLLSSSRPGSLPSNLQGVWNVDYKPPWNSDFHTNINLQMNYWPAERLGLGETTLPLFEWMKFIYPEGKKIARKHYGYKGWVLHHLSDRWGTCTPCDGMHGVWPLGAAWLCQHLWWHYEFSGNKSWLKKDAWILIKDAGRFILDFLIEAPQGSACPGKLVTNPSHSPENLFRLPDGTVSSLTYAATMDIAIIRELFRIILECEKVVNDFELHDRVRYALSKLPGYSISKKTGCLMEWIEDYYETDPGHRHFSHLFPVHPGIDISPHKTPELAEAAKNSILRRLAHRKPESVDHDTGWSLGWTACLWANLGEGDRALAAIKKCLAFRSTPNLMTNAHNAPQVGDAFGITEACLEMIVQDRDGILRLLPALPSEWKSGKANNLYLRGGHILNIEWQDHNNAYAIIKPGWRKTIRFADKTIEIKNKINIEIKKGIVKYYG